MIGTGRGIVIGSCSLGCGDSIRSNGLVTSDGIGSSVRDLSLIGLVDRLLLALIEQSSASELWFEFIRMGVLLPLTGSALTPVSNSCLIIGSV